MPSKKNKSLASSKTLQPKSSASSKTLEPKSSGSSKKKASMALEDAMKRDSSSEVKRDYTWES